MHEWCSAHTNLQRAAQITRDLKIRGDPCYSLRQRVRLVHFVNYNDRVTGSSNELFVRGLQTRHRFEDGPIFEAALAQILNAINLRKRGTET